MLIFSQFDGGTYCFIDTYITTVSYHIFGWMWAYIEGMTYRGIRRILNIIVLSTPKTNYCLYIGSVYSRLAI